MTSHHDKSKINFLCSLGETWSATPGPRKHPVLAPSSRQSLTLRLVAEQQLLGSHFSKEPGPLQNHPGRPHQDPTVRILPCLPTGLPCAGISFDIGAFELKLPTSGTDRSIDRLLARSVLTPITPRPSKSDIGEVSATNFQSGSIFHRGCGVQIARRSSCRRAFVAGKADLFVEG